MSSKMPKCFRKPWKTSDPSTSFKDGQSVDWNCCGEIALPSELVGLIARPNLGLLMFVCLSERFCVTNITCDGSVAKPGACSV